MHVLNDIIKAIVKADGDVVLDHKSHPINLYHNAKRNE